MITFRPVDTSREKGQSEGNKRKAQRPGKEMKPVREKVSYHEETKKREEKMDWVRERKEEEEGQGSHNQTKQREKRGNDQKTTDHLHRDNVVQSAILSAFSTDLD